MTHSLEWGADGDRVLGEKRKNRTHHTGVTDGLMPEHVDESLELPRTTPAPAMVTLPPGTPQFNGEASIPCECH